MSTRGTGEVRERLSKSIFYPLSLVVVFWGSRGWGSNLQPLLLQPPGVFNEPLADLVKILGTLVDTNNNVLVPGACQRVRWLARCGDRGCPLACCINGEVALGPITYPMPKRIFRRFL